MGNLLGSPVTTKDTHVGTTVDDRPGVDPSNSPDGGGMPFAVSSMQGWRVHMEDAHIAQPFLYAERRDEGGNGEDKGGGDDEKDKDVAVEATLSAEGGEAPAAEVRVTKADPSPPRPSSSAPPPPNGKKKKNEQTYVRVSLPNHSLFAVFDGHGGSFAAEYASRNLLRVLCRSDTFVEYAEKWNAREDHLAKLQAESGKGGEEKEVGDEGGSRPEDKKQKSEGNDGFEFARATYDHGLMTLLERSLRDAFLDLDAEILRAVEGDPVSEANAPYGEAEGGAGEGTAAGDGGDAKDAAMDDADASKGDGDGAAPQRAPSPSEDEDAGTTAVCVLLTPRWIVCANAGDSRAVYARSGHRAVPLSYDHKPDDEGEEGRIVDAGGYVSAGRVEGDLAVSRGLGDFRFKDPRAARGGSAAEGRGRGQRPPPPVRAPGATFEGGEWKEAEAPPPRPSEQKVSPVPDIIVQNRDPKEDEFVIIACDGIWDVQTNQECVQMVADVFEEGEADLGLVCEEILDLCLMKGSKDNMTAAVIKFPKQAVGTGGGVTARREQRGAANGRNGDGGGEQPPRAYNPYATQALRDESKGNDDDSDDDQWDSGK